MLEISNLVKIYPGPVAALRDVTLEIPHGTFGLLGPNGSGKTTLMKILAGLLEPTSGRVVLDGTDVTEQPEAVWPRLGNLPQGFGFYPNLSGEAMLLHLLRLKGVAAPGGLRRLCDELLERVNLTAAAKQRTKEYSGGMRQRLGIAQAIAGNPDLLIVDEPTAGLDPEERQRFYNLLPGLATERTVLLSTHIVEDVASLCPRMAFVRKGRILAATSPAEAREALSGTIYAGAATPKEVGGLPPTATLIKSHFIEGQNLCRLHLKEVDPPTGFMLSEPTLEDAYMLAMRAAEALETRPGAAA